MGSAQGNAFNKSSTEGGVERATEVTAKYNEAFVFRNIKGSEYPTITLPAYLSSINKN